MKKLMLIGLTLIISTVAFSYEAPREPLNESMMKVEAVMESLEKMKNKNIVAVDMSRNQRHGAYSISIIPRIAEVQSISFIEGNKVRVELVPAAPAFPGCVGTEFVVTNGELVGMEAEFVRTFGCVAN